MTTYPYLTIGDRVYIKNRRYPLHNREGLLYGTVMDVTPKGTVATVTFDCRWNGTQVVQGETIKLRRYQLALKEMTV